MVGPSFLDGRDGFVDWIESDWHGDLDEHGGRHVRWGMVKKEVRTLYFVLLSSFTLWAGLCLFVSFL